MKIKNFGVEMYMNAYEDGCTYNLAETCVCPLTVEELLELAGEKETALGELLKTRLTYGYIEGRPALRQAIASLYQNMCEKNITTTHGGIGANALVLQTLVEPGDVVVSVIPTYQQLYSIPESYGATVKLLPLNMENRFLPDEQLLESYMSKDVKLVCLNNPNNPSGAVMDEAKLRRIVDIVKPYGAYILCDEAYRGLTHEGNHLTPSIVDVYEKGIATATMSKTFSLAGLRLGWIAAQEHMIERISKQRDYSTISCGIIDEFFAAIALKNKAKIFERNLQIVRRNKAILDDWVNHEPAFSYIPPQGGTTAFLKMHVDMPSEAFCLKLLQETGVLLLPGSAMDMEGFVRIGYAFETEVLSTGLEKVSQFAAKLL